MQNDQTTLGTISDHDLSFLPMRFRMTKMRQRRQQLTALASESHADDEARRQDAVGLQLALRNVTSQLARANASQALARVSPSSAETVGPV